MAAAGPGLYSDIGKKARGLLYKDYHTDRKFTLTTYAANGAFKARVTMDMKHRVVRAMIAGSMGDGDGAPVHVQDKTESAITAASTRKDEAIFNKIQGQLKHNNVTVDVKAVEIDEVTTTITVHELATPGLKAFLCIPFPYKKSAKAELQYLHHHAGVAASVGLNANPVVKLSGVFGTKTVAVGADVAFDTSSGNLTKYNAGLSYSTSDFVAAATLNNKGDKIAASYYHSVSPTTAVGGELSHSFSTNGNTITFGTQHALDRLTTVKARFNNCGMASALIQHKWRPKSLVTISMEVDTKAIEKSSKIGLSLVLKP
ncbi:outer mitochondrial membrane protein porin isoform X2 [Zea mays]|uniref:outer mitochondrial membrane protein porin isoform X2 n=1 Tax=Zea mays TaxID=4577 RepID=UPI0009AAE904|nr:outer mitochondrial membrane protein porin isoform X2 [Zea mays]|eukprot:XP_020397777.1 outer mitochondrial membrane protein porin isoform X2 [Zea mays]